MMCHVWKGQHNRTGCLSCEAEAAGEAGLHARPAGMLPRLWHPIAAVTSPAHMLQATLSAPLSLSPTSERAFHRAMRVWHYGHYFVLQRHTAMCTPDDMPQG